MNPLRQTSCIILSAGSSGRIGQHKALLRYGSDKATFIEKITEEYANAGVIEIVVVVSEGLMAEIEAIHLNVPDIVRFVVNLKPDWNRFYSLKTGMQHITGGYHVFFQNVDNPFVEPELLHSMIGVSGKADVIIPEFFGRKGHPVLLSPDVCMAFLECKTNDLRIDDFLRSFRTVNLKTENPKVLVNINSMSDYKKEFPGLGEAG